MDEQSENKNDDLINAITSEISDCREDERNAQNMILQVIGTGGSILGVLTGASFFFEDRLIGELATFFSQSLFILSGLILCASYLYIYALGIGNVLRFHYLRGLEDRLSILLHGSREDNSFISWMSFSSPIMTRNPTHVKSVYAKIHFFSYVFATVCSGAFGLGIVSVLHDRITKPGLWNECFLYGFYIVMGVFLLIFLAVCVKGKAMYDYAINTALEKRKKRVSELLSTEQKKQNSNSTIPWKTVLSVCGYYLYPRIVDFQKPLLIIVGFLIGIFFKNGALIIPSWGQIGSVLLVWFVVDFLVYQARYLWNDLYGMKGDVIAGKTDRLPVHLIGEDNAILVALIVMILRLILALTLIAFMPKGMRGSILLISLLVFAVAIVYEYVSKKNCANGVYFMVSFGYPLRLLAGIFAAWPQFGRSALSFGENVVPIYTLIPMFIAFGLLGSYSSVLAWTHKAIDQVKKKKSVHKSYYKPLITKIGIKIDHKFPLKEQCHPKDHWCTIFIGSIFMLSAPPCMIAFGDKGFFMIMIAELLFAVFAYYFSYASSKKALIWGLGIAVVILSKATLASTAIAWHPFYCFICILQALFVFLYYFMRYMFTVDYSFVNACKGFAIQLLKIILGKETVDYYKEKHPHQTPKKK